MPPPNKVISEPKSISVKSIIVDPTQGCDLNVCSSAPQWPILWALVRYERGFHQEADTNNIGYYNCFIIEKVAQQSHITYKLYLLYVFTMQRPTVVTKLTTAKYCRHIWHMIQKTQIKTPKQRKKESKHVHSSDVFLHCASPSESKVWHVRPSCRVCIKNLFFWFMAVEV